MDIQANSGQFFEKFNEAVNQHQGDLPDKFYIHTLKDGTYEINANSEDGIVIDRKLAKFARAHLKDRVDVDSTKLKEFYMKRSVFKKIKELGFNSFS